MALTYRDAKEMFAAPTSAANYCSLPVQALDADMDFAYDAMRQGEIGRPYFADISFTRRYGIPTWGFFHMKQHNGGGAFCDLGVNFIDALLWMTSNPRVEAVSGKTFRLPRQTG
jgi:predicted dehydrogenase